MIDVQQVLRAVPGFSAFCSVKKLHDLVETLRGNSTGFHIEIAGMSAGGMPIHHVRFGQGSVKALFVGFPHCDEPIGGLTVFSLLTLLRQGNPALVNAGVEWHIVPCIDPDGAILNEGWTQTAFTLANYMRNFHKQELQDQVEMSFPIEHKRLVFGRPVKEAKILQGLLEEIRPDFYHSLHNAITGGAFFCLTRDIHRECYSQLYELLRQHRIPLQENPPDQAWCVQFAAGVEEAFTTRKFYDFLEKTTPFPEGQLQAGACSWEYLTQIKPGALTFIAELPYLKHSSDGSTRETGENLRRLKLRLDAENKFLITVILEAWEKVKDDLNLTSPFYRKIASGMVSVKSTLHEGLPSWPYKTRDILFNPGYSGTMTEGERFNTYVMGRFYILCHSYEFVRLLKASTQTDSVREATGRLEAIFDEALRELEIDIDAQAFQVIDYDTLAKVQLGSGLIVLNSILAR